MNSKVTTKMELVETISRETIRPFSPTPPEKRLYNLSFLDHFNPSIYVPIVYFYTNQSSDIGSINSSNISNQLKKSLSKALALYYPFAGRIKDRVSIDCNDDGVVFVETRIKCKLSEVLENPKEEILELLFADRLQWKDWSSNSFLAIQISFFESGGIAIGFCISHKLADTATMINFINLWASIARNSGVDHQETLFPEFNAASRFPHHDDLPLIPEAKIAKGNSHSKRFVFTASKIDALKAEVADKVQNPSRVEVVTAIIHKAAISASKSSSGGSSNPNVLVQSVNMRTRTNPPLPETSVGNMSWFYAVPSMGEKEIKLHDLVGKLKESLTSFCKKYAERFIGKDWSKLIMECMKDTKQLFHGNNLVVYRYSSWCRFPLYEADFGWGKPIWVTIGSCELKNSIIMMDTRGGDGIEAIVNLEKEDMDVFENDLELLQFASLNPGAIMVE
ncbi:acyltransferase Pun1 [Ziziphus jujuba]|uniref:Acyltransferase Pun1 n=1 Tax=Ziziphus jujuba TaxID=326968 RepID=A0A6P4AFX5_ZIZJJ|nr:acyltransferase Pun1 [Ziziphus jujuba]